MSWGVWTVFAVTEGALCATPGPAVLFVVSQGLRGLPRALWSALGILGANAFYFALSGTGLGMLLASSGELFPAVRWVGAGYLLYLAVGALSSPPPTPGALPTAMRPPSAPVGALFRGLFVQIANPKALLFFAAILPQFVDRAEPVLPQLVVLGATSMAVELVVLAAYGAAAARAGRLAAGPRVAWVTSRLSGALLGAAALGLASFAG